MNFLDLGWQRAVGIACTTTLHAISIIVLWNAAPRILLAPPPRQAVVAFVMAPSVVLGESARKAAALVEPKTSIDDDRLIRVLESAAKLNPPAVMKPLSEIDALSRKDELDVPQAASPVSIQRAGEEVVDPADSLMSLLRANWLPPRVRMNVRCRLSIRYDQNAMVRRVEIEPDCADAQIIASIERAVWKTQPLPVRRDPTGGTIEVEFTP